RQLLAQRHRAGAVAVIAEEFHARSLDHHAQAARHYRATFTETKGRYGQESLRMDTTSCDGTSRSTHPVSGKCSAVKHRPADVVPQPLVVKYELADRLR